jgi:hypothetical protein
MLQMVRQDSCNLLRSYNMYKQCINYDGTIAPCTIRLSDKFVIPFAPDNTDYQAYLKWLEEGGVPLPADE